MGTIEDPINDSKGCGGVMRVTPVGLMADNVEEATHWKQKKVNFLDR
jgi:ADP-ribosylglycohydrolase